MQPLFSSAIRSHFGMESFNTHSYNCLSRGHGFPSRTHDNRGMDPVQDNSFTAGGNGTEAGENMSPTADGDQTIKDTRSKRVVSPSNA
ncbi:RING-H2 finger protein ATL38 [Corchorus olitorius]|uniref:RING-H2 finger protein ATL38 n=1 Tax=Corchorus olitorius TaxID=93759 RepID=A0A1R3KR87_9ROSI|nr:RING-H2 finger protein ATL38 [Corchorus olitorius]